MKVEKFDYTLHPESRKFQKSRASNHVPEWRKNPDVPEADFTNLVKPKAKPKKPKAAKSTAPPASTPVKFSEECNQTDLSVDFHSDTSSDLRCKIIMTDKQSIMS